MIISYEVYRIYRKILIKKDKVVKCKRWEATQDYLVEFDDGRTIWLFHKHKAKEPVAVKGLHIDD